MPADSESEVDTVALYGTVFGATLFLLSPPGRQLVAHGACALFLRALSASSFSAFICATERHRPRELLRFWQTEVGSWREGDTRCPARGMTMHGERVGANGDEVDRYPHLTRGAAR